MDQLPRFGKRELICLLLFTCNYVVSVWRGFLFLWVLGMGYVILLWHSLSLPYNYFSHRTKKKYRSLTSLNVIMMSKTSHLTSLKRHNDVINLLQKQARSHATKTGVHHLKSGVHHIYIIQKCTIWTNEKSFIFRLYNKNQFTIVCGKEQLTLADKSRAIHTCE